MNVRRVRKGRLLHAVALIAATVLLRPSIAAADEVVAGTTYTEHDGQWFVVDSGNEWQIVPGKVRIRFVPQVGGDTRPRC